MLQKIKNLASRLVISIYSGLLSQFTKVKVEQEREVNARYSEVEPVQELDEWALLMQDLSSPDPEVRMKAEAIWKSKRGRNMAFFAGIHFPEKAKHLRGIPQELRQGWDRSIDPAFEDDVRDPRTNIPLRPYHGGDMYEDIHALSKGKSAYEQLDELRDETESVDIPTSVIQGYAPNPNTGTTVRPNRAQYNYDTRDESQKEDGQVDDGSSQ